jgi:hypothetical protein
MLLPEKYVSYRWTKETPRVVKVIAAAVGFKWSNRPRKSPASFAMEPPTTTFLALKLREFGEKRGWYIPMDKAD